MPDPIDYASPKTEDAQNPLAQPPRRSIFTLIMVMFVSLLGFGLVIPLLPFYAIKFNAGAVEIGLILAIFSGCQFISSPILGSLSDRYGRRPMLILSQCTSVIGYIMLAFAGWYDFGERAWLGLGVIYASRVIDGVGGGAISVAQAYISDITEPRDRAKYMGMLGAAFGVGFAVGPAIGGLLGHYSEAFPALLAAVACAVAAAMVYWLLPESHTDRTTTSISGFALSAERLKVITHRPIAMQITLVWFVSMIAFVMLEPTVVVLLADVFKFGPKEVGIYFGAVGMVIVAVQGGLIGRLTRTFGEWPIAIAGPLIATCGMLLFSQLEFRHWLWLLAIAALCNGIGRSLLTPTLTSLLSQNIDRRMQGSAFGVYYGFGSLARVIGPIVGGVLFEWHPWIMFVVAACLTATAGVWLFYLARVARGMPAEADEPAVEAAV